MTDPTGLSFVSYRRSRTEECTRLVAALRERGIPTWRDVDDLNTEPTETELRRVLGDDSVASAILWISPETADSSIIRKVEAPVALDRHARQDGFFVVPVAAGELGYEEAAEAIRTGTSIIDVGRWNIVKLQSDPASQADIAEVANRVLRQRLQAIDSASPAGCPASNIAEHAAEGWPLAGYRPDPGLEPQVRRHTAPRGREGRLAGKAAAVLQGRNGSDSAVRPSQASVGRRPLLPSGRDRPGLPPHGHSGDRRGLGTANAGRQPPAVELGR